MSRLENQNIQQEAIINLFSPFIDEIVDRVSEKVLSVTSKKEPKFYTRKEVASILHVTLPTLTRLTKDGLITSKQVGSRILYEADAIDEAVKKQVIFKYKRSKVVNVVTGRHQKGGLK